MGKTYTAEQWRTVDLTIRTTKEYDNPFEDVDVFGCFAGPNGENLKILGFWDGNGTWIIRFAPTAVGTWNYTITSTDAENADFCEEGSIECKAYEGDLDIYRHGGVLKVSEDRSHFTYTDGTPFFWLGDTHWTLIAEERFDSNHAAYENQFQACLDKRVAQKFTVYQSNFREGEIAGMFGRSIDLMHDCKDGKFLPVLDNFKNNVDIKMKAIADAGLVNAMGYAWFYDMPTNGLERYKKLAKYTAARYGAYPIVWTLAGEIPGYMPDKVEWQLAQWTQVAKECKIWNAYGNLASVHLANARPFPVIYTDEEWLDFIMCQAGHGDFVNNGIMYLQAAEAYKMPFIESESCYEGAFSLELNTRPITAAMTRRVAYICMQTGGAGYTYGALGVWELSWRKGVGGIGWGDMPWWEGLELPGADQMTILRDFYESVDWTSLKPIHIENEMNSWTDRVRCFFTANDSKTTFVGYFQETSNHPFTLEGMTAGKYTGYWVLPENGRKLAFMGGKVIEPADGVFTYDDSDHFPARTDRLLVLTAVEE